MKQPERPHLFSSFLSLSILLFSGITQKTQEQVHWQDYNYSYWGFFTEYGLLPACVTSRVSRCCGTIKKALFIFFISLTFLFSVYFLGSHKDTGTSLSARITRLPVLRLFTECGLLPACVISRVSCSTPRSILFSMWSSNRSMLATRMFSRCSEAWKSLWSEGHTDQTRRHIPWLLDEDLDEAVESWAESHSALKWPNPTCPLWLRPWASDCLNDHQSEWALSEEHLNPRVDQPHPKPKHWCEL